MFSLEDFKKGAGRAAVIDVESIGLHGEAFAVAAVGITADGVFAELCYSCPPDTAAGTVDDRFWVAGNVPRLQITHANPKEMRQAFWEKLQVWKEEGSMLFADCTWPVEARFLCDCVSDDPLARNWEGPYPLMDLAPILWVNGINPLTPLARLSGEMPFHHPLTDARQSARLLLEVLGCAVS